MNEAFESTVPAGFAPFRLCIDSVYISLWPRRFPSKINAQKCCLSDRKLCAGLIPLGFTFHSDLLFSIFFFSRCALILFLFVMLFRPITMWKSMNSTAARRPYCVPANEGWQLIRQWASSPNRRAPCCRSTMSITASAPARAPTMISSIANLKTSTTTLKPCQPPTSATR